MKVSSEDFAETGGATALHASKQDNNVTFTTLGLRGAATLDLGGARLIPHASVGWRHAYGDIRPEAQHAFSAGDAFTIEGAPIAKNSAAIEAGFDLALSPTLRIGAAYIGQLASEATQHGVSGRISIQF